MQPHPAPGDEEQFTYELPKGFMWGTATSAYQIEGAWDLGGRGWSIWDSFTHCQGRVHNGATGDVACDHYHRFEEDVALMASLGIRAYRFSLSWPRIQPMGRGTANAEGLHFYDKLIDCLLAHGITPVVTLYHWDLPLALQVELGGWLSPEIVPLFGEYARIVFSALAGRVKWWITLNEPWCCAVFGHGTQLHAPGRLSRDASLIYQAGHHLLLAHAEAVHVFRKELGLNAQGCRVGISLNANWVAAAPSTGPVSKKLNQQAADRALIWNISWFADPICNGDYPEVMRHRCGSRLPHFDASERARLKSSCDFLGLNHYMTEWAEPELWGGSVEQMGHIWCQLIDGPSENMQKTDNYIWSDLQVKLKTAAGGEAPASQSDMGWAIAPEGLQEVLLWAQRRYPQAEGLFVTENGLGCRSEALEDTDRIQYLRDYITSMVRAVRLGADVRGYFSWTFLDNFEWQDGYRYRFGLVHVDFATLCRTPRASARWYASMVSQSSLSDEVTFVAVD